MSLWTNTHPKPTNGRKILWNLRLPSQVINMWHLSYTKAASPSGAWSKCCYTLETWVGSLNIMEPFLMEEWEGWVSWDTSRPHGLILCICFHLGELLWQGAERDSGGMSHVEEGLSGTLGSSGWFLLLGQGDCVCTLQRDKIATIYRQIIIQIIITTGIVVGSLWVYWFMVQCIGHWGPRHRSWGYPAVLYLIHRKSRLKSPFHSGAVLSTQYSVLSTWHETQWLLGSTYPQIHTL
jgi:hypothetical protein